MALALAVTLAAPLQQHRDTTLRTQSGDTATDHDAARAALRLASQALHERTVTTPAAGLAERRPAVHDALCALAEGRHDPQRTKAFDEHSEQVAALHELVLLAAERSGLPLDPEAHTRRLMDTTVERGLPWSETLGLPRGQGGELLARRRQRQ